MDYDSFRDVYCDVIPIIQKAAPIIGTFLGSPLTAFIIGLFASIVDHNACDTPGIAQKMKDDENLYAKLAKLDSTHGEWLKSIRW